MPKLKDEVKKVNPFESPEQEAALNVHRTAQKLADGLAEVFKRHDLTPTQYNVLRILRGAGAVCGRSGLPCREVGQRMVTRDPDMTRLLDRMEKRGLIHRTRDADDRRVVKVAIAEPGLSILKDLDAPVLDAHRRQLAHMTREQLQTLIELLELARDGES